MKKIKLGYYTVIAEPLAFEPGSLTPKEATKRYMDLLTEQILDNPSLWLWSHRRWKSTPPVTLSEHTHGD